MAYTPTMRAHLISLRILKILLIQSLFIVGVSILWAENAHADLTAYIPYCESRENDQAINWKDAEYRKDKEPSRGRWQFYWKTWVYYAKIYKVIPEDLELTAKETNWYLHHPIWSSAVAHGMVRDGIAKNHWENCTRAYYSQLARK